MMNFKYSHTWILHGIQRVKNNREVIDRIEHALGLAIEDSEAELIRQHVVKLKDEEKYDDYKLPFPLLAKILERYTSVGWAGNDHSGDFVELALFGPGSEQLPPFVKNTDLHNFMLTTTETVAELVQY